MDKIAFAIVLTGAGIGLVALARTGLLSYHDCKRSQFWDRRDKEKKL